MKIKIIAMMIGLSAMQVYAESTPRQIRADQHVKVVAYDPNNVVSLKGQYGYQIQIVFAANETIQAVSLGDSIAWQTAPVANNLFIKPIASSKTNMTVITSGNIYNFQLDSEDVKASPTYKLQFTYPPGGFDQGGNANAVATVDPTKVNWKYTFTGEKSLAPIEAFDDGRFTYFKFKTDGMSRTPSVFIVDQNRNETLINYHMQGDYLVVHAVAKQFTLRDGAFVTSVYNDAAIGDWTHI